MSISSVSGMLGMSYPYMYPYISQMQGAYLGNYGLINSLSGAGYENILKRNTIEDTVSFAKILEKISEQGNREKGVKSIEEKTESKEEGKVQNRIPMTMISRNIPRIHVVTGIENMEVKRINPYVTIVKS